MKMRIITVIAALALMACSNEPNQNEMDVDQMEDTLSAADDQENQMEESTANVPDRVTTGCYTYTEAGNILEFEVTEVGGDTVIGKLQYNLAEGEKTIGTFNGHMEDGMLYGEYTFESDGREGTRELAFRINGNQLIEGHGEMTEEGDHAEFVNPDSLDYTSRMPLTKSDCGVEMSS